MKISWVLVFCILCANFAFAIRWDKKYIAFQYPNNCSVTVDKEEITVKMSDTSRVVFNIHKNSAQLSQKYSDDKLLEMAVLAITSKQYNAEQLKGKPQVIKVSRYTSEEQKKKEREELKKKNAQMISAMVQNCKLRTKKETIFLGKKATRLEFEITEKEVKTIRSYYITVCNGHTVTASLIFSVETSAAELEAIVESAAWTGKL